MFRLSGWRVGSQGIPGRAEEAATSIGEIDRPDGTTDSARDYGASAPPWPWTLACGLVTLALGAAAVILPLSLGRPLAQSAGWILFIGGIVEVLLGTTCARSPLGKAALLCGGLTALAGFVFIGSDLPELFTLTNLIMVWLFARALILLFQGFVAERQIPPVGHWLVVRGIIDAALGGTLLLSLPIVALMVVTFGETWETITTFSGLLSISFLVTGISLLATALAKRRLGIGGNC